MSEWKKVKLGDIYEIYSGLSKGRSEFGFGYPFLTFKEVFNNYFIPDNLENLVNSTEKERERCSIKRGDIFLTRTSETANELGMSCVALKDYDNATFNGFTKRLRLKEGIDIEINPEYIGYYLRSPKIRNCMSSLSTMTTRASLNSSMINNIVLELPGYDIQVEIGKMLKVLDDKIELNNRINKTLEEMAQAIFKSWFVDFEPFQDGEFEDSELGRIPKGWSVGVLDDIIELFDSKRIPLSSRKRETMKKLYPYYGATSLMDYVDNYIFDGIYVLLGEDGTVVDSNGYPILQYVWGKFWVNNHAHILKGKNGFNEDSIYIILKNTNVQGIVTGAVQLKINQANLKSVKVIIPTTEDIKKYNYLLEPLFAQKRRVLDENQRLTEVRDSLLPKLMSGEIRVPTERVQ